MRLLRPLMVAALLPLLTSCGPDADARADAAASTAPDCASDNGGLTLADGFCALVAHDGVGRARHIAVAPNGHVYVALRTPSGGGAIVALRDTNGDGRLDDEARFGETGGTGIAVHDGWLYFAPNTRVVRYRLGDQLVPAGDAQDVVTGFPQQESHAAKTIAFDGAGGLYVNVGAPSNACQVADRQAGSPGQDPCPERELQTGIWRFDLKVYRSRSRTANDTRRAYATPSRSTGIPRTMRSTWYSTGATC